MNVREKTCANCKNFKRYFVLNVSLRFTPTDRGYCIERKTDRCRLKLEVVQDETCELWQSNELQKLRGQYAAENILQDISDKLEVVRVLLSEDKQ